jgi:hypothetical protein
VCKDKKEYKINNNIDRNINLTEFDEIKKSSVISFINKLKENPNEKINFINNIEKTKSLVTDFLNEYGKLTGENYKKNDFEILMGEQRDSNFLSSTDKVINKLIKFSGLLTSLSSDDLIKYRLHRPKLISYAEHMDHFREPILDEYACMHNDINSSESYCYAQRDHGITLKTSPYYDNVPFIVFNEKNNKEEIVYKKTEGLCLYCERYLVNLLFELNKKRGVASTMILNR